MRSNLPLNRCPRCGGQEGLIHGPECDRLLASIDRGAQQDRCSGCGAVLGHAPGCTVVYGAPYKKWNSGGTDVAAQLAAQLGIRRPESSDDEFRESLARAMRHATQQARCLECGTLMGDRFHAFQACSIWRAMQTGMRAMTQAEINAIRGPGAYRNVGCVAPGEYVEYNPETHWIDNSGKLREMVGTDSVKKAGPLARLLAWLKERW